MRSDEPPESTENPAQHPTPAQSTESGSHDADISAIVPARNEELNIAACVRSLARQPQIAEIIVVNDQSADGTAGVLAALRAEILRLRVLETPELPPGWVGKNHAASLGAAAARGAWLLFTDADVTHLDGSAERALADAERTGAALVSYSPDQEIRTWGEQALMPFVFVRLGVRFSYEAVSDLRSAAAGANGQYLMIRRETYAEMGGHAAVRGEVLEDVALARRVKESGQKIYFARGAGIASTRMYRGFGEMWRGWTKNLYPLLGGMTGAVSEVARTSLWAPLILLGVLGLGGIPLAAGLLLLLVQHFVYARELQKNRYPLSSILYFVPGALLYSAVVWQSAATHRNGRVEWKGRVYPAQRPGPTES